MELAYERQHLDARIRANRPVRAYGQAPTPDMGDAVSMINTALALFQVWPMRFLGIGADKKAGYKEWSTASVQLVKQYGPDVVTTATALQLNPNMVAQSASEYLRDDYSITLSPSQIIAASPALGVGAAGSSLPVILMIGGAAVVLFLVLKG